NQLEKNEEEQDIYYLKTYINQLRNGVRTAGRMSQIRVRILQLMKEASPQLIRWMARARETQIVRAFLEGYSTHIMAAKVDGGLNIGSQQKICHPNFYAAGDGFVTWSATDSTYESSVDTAVGNVTDTASDHFTTTLVENMAVEVQTKNIKPMESINGYSFIPWLISPGQAKQLRAETDWKTANSRAFIAGMAKDNPIFTRAMGEYGGFVFFERQLSVFGVDPSGSGTVTFGASNPLSALDTFARKCSIIFGASAIATGQAEKSYLDVDDYDYKNQTGIAIGSIVGDARADFVDNTASKTAVINQSSIIVATYSP
ncbi:MAG: phage capsid family protein, partial [Candidatus Anammoxibacter sp.]